MSNTLRLKGISYKAGYKYQLVNSYIHKLPPTFPIINEIETDYLWLGMGGKFSDLYTRLIVKSGYAWDGPSGPTIDTKNFMRGSLVHDALYQLMRYGHLDKNVYRIHADRELQHICIEDGMCWIRAQFVYWGVRIGGNPGARYGNENPVIGAP